MGTVHKQPVLFESFEFQRRGDELQSALMESPILWYLYQLVLHFVGSRKKSKGHYSKKSNCVRLVRKICILSLPCCMPQKKSPVFQFYEKCPSFEMVLFYISPNSTLSHAVSHQSYIPLSAKILEISFQQQLVQDNVHFYFSGSIFQFSCQNVCIHNELVLRHFRFQLIPSIRLEQTKLYLKSISLQAGALVTLLVQSREKN